MPKRNTKITKNTAISRYGWIALLFSLVFIAVIVCVCKTKFVEGEMWRKLGKEAISKENRSVRPNRGNIYADDGRLLATSEPLYGIYIDFMAEGIKKDTLMKYVTPLSQELAKRYKGKTAAQYKKLFLDSWALSRKELEAIERNKQNGSNTKIKTKSRYVRIIPQDINYVELKELRKLPFLNQKSNRCGLIAEERTKRLKPFGRLAGRTVGTIYKDVDKGGASGLELKYDSILRGEPGLKSRQRISGKWIDIVQVEPKDGCDIQTTINVDVQDIAEKALYKKLAELKAESGCAIVMEVETGEIKALVNLDRISDGTYGEGNPNAFSYMSEPGSTFKAISLMVALEDGVITPQDSFYVGTGQFQYNNKIIKDHDWRKYKDKGYLTVTEGMYMSSNVVLAKMILKGYEKNPKKYVEGIYKLGLGKKLTWDVPLKGREGIASIRFPNDPHNPWSKTTLPWMSFGYETQIPPIYILMFYNGIANNGKMIKPFITKAFLQNGSTKEEFEAEVLNKSLCSKRTLKQVQEILRGVVTNGTGKAVNSNLVNISGKTGTAMIATRGGYEGYYVSFCGYFPSDKPKYTCFVGVRHPQGSPSGGLMAGTVFKEIAEAITIRDIARNPLKPQTDTINIFTPKVKNGRLDNTEFVLSKLGQKFVSPDIVAEWIDTRTTNNQISLIPHKIQESIMPNVIGMGAKDAIYLLENMNLNVKLSGAGKVIEQSVPEGSRLVKGTTVTIILN